MWVHKSMSTSLNQGEQCSIPTEPNSSYCPPFWLGLFQSHPVCVPRSLSMFRRRLEPPRPTSPARFAWTHGGCRPQSCRTEHSPGTKSIAITPHQPPPPPINNPPFFFGRFRKMMAEEEPRYPMVSPVDVLTVLHCQVLKIRRNIRHPLK